MAVSSSTFPDIHRKDPEEWPAERAMPFLGYYCTGQEDPPDSPGSSPPDMPGCFVSGLRLCTSFMEGFQFPILMGVKTGGPKSKLSVVGCVNRWRLDLNDYTNRWQCWDTQEEVVGSLPWSYKWETQGWSYWGVGSLVLAWEKEGGDLECTKQEIASLL